MRASTIGELDPIDTTAYFPKVRRKDFIVGLNLQTSGIYHTDFPQYIRILTEDSFLESVAWGYMHWFYGQVDTVFVNSEEFGSLSNRLSGWRSFSDWPMPLRSG